MKWSGPVARLSLSLAAALQNLPLQQFTICFDLFFIIHIIVTVSVMHIYIFSSPYAKELDRWEMICRRPRRASECKSTNLASQIASQITTSMHHFNLFPSHSRERASSLTSSRMQANERTLLSRIASNKFIYHSQKIITLNYFILIAIWPLCVCFFCFIFRVAAAAGSEWTFCVLFLMVNCFQ